MPCLRKSKAEQGLPKTLSQHRVDDLKWRLDFYVHLHIGVVQLRTLELVLYLLDPDEFDEARLNLSLLLRYPLGIRRGGCCPVSFDIRRTGEKTMCGTYDSESVRALRAWASRSSRTVIRSIGVLRGLVVLPDHSGSSRKGRPPRAKAHNATPNTAATIAKVGMGA